jgi:Stage II sporulation protein M
VALVEQLEIHRVGGRPVDPDDRELAALLHLKVPEHAASIPRSTLAHDLPMRTRMSVNDLVLVQGMKDTRLALALWRRERWAVLRSWLLLSLAIGAGLLLAIYAVARLSTPDPTALSIPGYNAPATLGDYGLILYRNSLVLALHAMACVAGFMAGSSIPLAASKRSGLDRWVHEKAGPLAIAFVLGATLFSLATQAYAIGTRASTIAWQLEIGPGTLITTLLPHAVPELVALFLPLAAWLIASRREQWNQLLAATFVTVAVAMPMLLVSAAVELLVSPRLLLHVTGW